MNPHLDCRLLGNVRPSIANSNPFIIIIITIVIFHPGQLLQPKYIATIEAPVDEAMFLPTRNSLFSVKNNSTWTMKLIAGVHLAANAEHGNQIHQQMTTTPFLRPPCHKSTFVSHNKYQEKIKIVYIPENYLLP